MGALTLKSFPFELRGWDIEKFESIDPTDGFGLNTRVYINKNQIIQIEPDYNIHCFNIWLTDKGRQFFDGIHHMWWNTKDPQKNHLLDKNVSLQIQKLIIQILYTSDHCNKNDSKNYFFTIVVENVSLEILSFLLIVFHSYTFIKLRRAESFKLNNDLESNYQINLSANTITKLNSSTLCLLVSTNPRYEGSYLNLNLRQRFFKGNFKCLLIGALIDLTFPIFFLGSNTKALTTIIEGNNLICQDLKLSKNPILIYNTDLSKRHDGQKLVQIIKLLQYSSILHKIWNNLNILNSTLTETGVQNLTKLKPFNLQDSLNFSSLYFINVTVSSISNMKKIVELKLLNNCVLMKRIYINNFLLDQNVRNQNNITFFNNYFYPKNKKIDQYCSLPISMFYENKETFINTEGFVKRTNKLISQNRTKNSWQTLRKIVSYLKQHITFLDKKNSEILFFNAKKTIEFTNFISFQYCAAHALTKLAFYLSIQNKNFLFSRFTYKFKQNQSKIINTKLKYWLDDFFSGGKDGYSNHSLILTNCSEIVRSESTNFF
jgi:hypothetical protein